ncbi:MAG TPA: arsenate reductase (glutaredoxin) [Myxococcales bacterium]|nr:arsenate reductase (glutaredoxin) [Myxococcales bacterium]
MLKQREIEFTYRDYTKEPLSRSEIVDILDLLNMQPAQLMRARQAKKLGLSGQQDGDAILDAMVAEPTLVQRPIALLGSRAVLARPVEQLTTLLEGVDA